MTRYFSCLGPHSGDDRRREGKRCLFHADLNDVGKFVQRFIDADGNIIEMQRNITLLEYLDAGNIFPHPWILININCSQ